MAQSLLCTSSAIVGIKPYIVKVITFNFIATTKSIVVAFNFIAQPTTPYMELIKLGYLSKEYAFLLVPLIFPIYKFIPFFIVNVHNMLLDCLSRLYPFSGKVLELVEYIHQYILYIKYE
jgi:hypothetical protein